MPKVITVLGFVVAVVGPVAAALAANPLVAAHAQLVSVLAVVGMVVMACGVIRQWQESQQTHQQTMFTLQHPEIK